MERGIFRQESWINEVGFVCSQLGERAIIKISENIHNERER